MSTIHEWSPPDVGQLTQELHERLGIEDAASVVGSILETLARLGCICGGIDRVALAAQAGGESSGEIELVLDDKKAHGGAG